MKAAIDLCAFENSKDIKIGMFYNTQDGQSIAETKRLLHKHDFLQVGFMIDAAWYDVTKDNYVMKTYGQSLGGHAVNLAGYD